MDDSGKRVPAGYRIACDGMFIGVTAHATALKEGMVLIGTVGPFRVNKHGIFSVLGPYVCDPTRDVCQNCVFKQYTHVPACARFADCEKNVVDHNLRMGRTHRPVGICE